MVFSIITLVSALSISGVAAYFSILGLATIFPGSPVSVIIMGIVLEIGKIIAAVWLHKNWKRAHFLIKTYLSFAILVLMGITSMGIFGFLSKSHIEHQAQTLHEETLIATLETKINKENDLIKRQEAYIASSQKRLTFGEGQSNVDVERGEKRIAQILESLDKNIAIEQSRIDRLVERRKELDEAVALIESKGGGLFSSKKKKLAELKAAQAAEREEISAALKTYNSHIETFRKEATEEVSSIRLNIESLQTQSSTSFKDIRLEIDDANTKIRESMDTITDLQKEKLQYGEKIRAIQTEIGPLKYVAEVVADMGGSELEADKAVRIIILIIMLVFDPLAILLIIAANISLSKRIETAKLKKVLIKDEDAFDKLKVKSIAPALTEDKMDEVLDTVRKEFAPVTTTTTVAPLTTTTVTPTTTTRDPDPNKTGEKHPGWPN